MPIRDLVKRDFNASAINKKWCGDLTEIPTDEGKLYLATVEDLASRRLAGFAIGSHHDADLARAALCMAAAVRGGNVAGVIFHTDKGGEGGFNWWSQHLDREVVCDGCWEASAGDSCDAGEDMVAGSSVDGAA